MTTWKDFYRSQDGAAVAEYALLLALISAVALIGVGAVGTSLSALWADVMAKWP
ncbi:Flp family type IVb pilin [Roseiconus nitratireducens]|uniref:Flp family type IVb pilin n=1 Tax=Roseiconus nitratireducens TaxID=2605748 RepID=A0A5M6D1F5_9BACT|nr:Flp family type IVb pilin [Roseiconus nitratireducens]KAA5541341.1 Flp family type IVb pilin [Roseiconus nitratireducens]